MALTSRGKALVAGGAVVAVLGGGMAALALSGNAPTPIQEALNGMGIAPAPIEPCPLTGETLPGDKQPPDRPVLAVKVENAPEARPQSGLGEADIVYEEPVEGGVTRFIAMFHCDDTKRLGPVRSARTTDVSVLTPLDTPLFGFAGGSNLVKKAVAESDVVDLNYIDAAEQYARDESREAPHNLYTKTKALFKAAKAKGGAAEPIFSYGDIADRSRPIGGVHLLFSEAYADVNWTWDGGSSAWLRSHGTEPHMLENGRQVSAENIVVLHVKVKDSKVLEDVAGYPSPEVTLSGSGKAWLFRDGRVVLGRWTRDGDEDYVLLETKDGNEMKLAPGTTWVELLPTTVPVGIAKR